MTKEIKKILDRLENISTPTGISYSGDVTIPTDDVIKLKDYITNLQQNYERIYNENCKLREEHNITDISLLDENERLKQTLNEIIVSDGKTTTPVLDLIKENERLRIQISAREEIVEDLIKYKNIVEELENWLKEEHNQGYEVYYLMAIQDTLNKLQKLKGDSDE